jgi:chemotaxis protein methyltransferase CheR
MLSHLTTNFTRFFRENHHFEHLRDPTSARSCCSAPKWRPGAHLVRRVLGRAGALFDCADGAVDDAEHCRLRFQDSGNRYRPEDPRDGPRRRLRREPRWKPSPAMRKQWFNEVESQGRQKVQVDDRVKR